MKDQFETSQLQLPGLPLASYPPDYVESVHSLGANDVERLKAMRPKKLGIVCGRSECEKKLHSFRRPLSKAGLPSGGCQVCGTEVVPWEFMQARDIGDISLKVDLLKTEWIRHFFFNLPISPRIQKFAELQGLAGLEQIAHDHLTKDKMLNFNGALDWNQTKMLDGNIVHWARHAVACCCRRCLAYWHNIPLGATLTATDVDYFRQFIMSYVKLRLPILDSPPTAIIPAAVSVIEVRKAV
jgi:hypothetical protein